jgi:hypothetical protein
MMGAFTTFNGIPQSTNPAELEKMTGIAIEQLLQVQAQARAARIAEEEAEARRQAEREAAKAKAEAEAKAAQEKAEMERHAKKQRRLALKLDVIAKITELETKQLVVRVGLIGITRKSGESDLDFLNKVGLVLGSDQTSLKQLELLHASLVKPVKPVKPVPAQEGKYIPVHKRNNK